MMNRAPRYLDMTPDGRFREPPATPIATRIARTALAVAVLAGVLSALILALWFALALIPVAIVAALVAWVAYRFQLWRARRSFSRQPDILRP
jgi:Flp pilus assembly protein TadB